MDNCEGSTNPIENKTIEHLSKGILEKYEPPLATISTHLRELTEKQTNVLTKMTAERRRLEDLQNDADLDSLIANLATSKERLTSVGSSMKDIHKKVQSLRLRAANIEKAARLKNIKNEAPS